METQIPFGGFYCSIHDEQLNYEIESMFSDDRGECNPDLLSAVQDAVNWSKVFEEYAKTYAETFASLFELKLEWSIMTSPREYNFETDRIFCKISRAEVLRMRKAVKREALQLKIKANFTSRDGFISHYPNDLKRWPRRISEWDYNEVGTLLSAYIETHDNYSADWEFNLLERMREETYAILSNNIGVIKLDKELFESFGATEFERLYGYQLEDNETAEPLEFPAWYLNQVNPNQLSLDSTSSKD